MLLIFPSLESYNPDLEIVPYKQTHLSCGLISPLILKPAWQNVLLKSSLDRQSNAP